MRLTKKTFSWGEEGGHEKRIYGWNCLKRGEGANRERGSGVFEREGEWGVDTPMHTIIIDLMKRQGPCLRIPRTA